MTKRQTLCGFCNKGTYHYDSGRSGKCPYCDGTGLTPQTPSDPQEADRER